MQVPTTVESGVGSVQQDTAGWSYVGLCLAALIGVIGAVLLLGRRGGAR